MYLKVGSGGRKRSDKACGLPCFLKNRKQTKPREHKQSANVNLAKMGKKGWNRVLKSTVKKD